MEGINLIEVKAVSFAVGQAYELYNLEEDSGEKNNIASKNPEIIEKITKYAKEAHEDNPNFPIKNCVSS